MPPVGPDSWPESDSKRQWLVFYRVDGMCLIGGGIIEGHGEGWWNLSCKPHRVIISSSKIETHSEHLSAILSYSLSLSFL